jgi:ABC-type amino acid transport substrate-binding protein
MEDLQSFLIWYRELCLTHPGLAIVAGLFALASFGWGAVKVTGELLATARKFLDTKGRFARPLHILVLVGIGLVVIAAIAAPSFVRNAAAARPVITAPRGRVLDQRPVVRWEYADARPDTRYRLAVTDRETGRHHHQCTQQTVLPLAFDGRLSLKVEAYTAGTQPNDCESISAQAESEDVPVELFHDSVDRIRHLKTLAYAVHHDASDGLFCYESDGKYLGFDSELVELIASELQRKYHIGALKLIPYDYSWEQIFEAPRSAQVDLAIASISITEQRKARYDVLFSQPYWASELALIVPRSNGDPRPFLQFAMADLRGKRIGYHQTTTAADFVPTLSRALSGMTTFRSAQDNEQLFGMLSNAAVDGVLYDLDRSWSAAPIGSKWIPARLDLQRLGYRPEQYGLMFASLNGHLKADVDQALAEIGTARIRDLLGRHIATLPGMSECPPLLTGAWTLGFSNGPGCTIADQSNLDTQ